MAPKDENDLAQMIYTATRYKKGPIAIRYPRGTGLGTAINRKLKRISIGRAEKIVEGKDLSIIAIGSMVYPAILAAEELRKKNIFASVYDAKFAKPLDKTMIKEAAFTGKVITVEENILDGGFGSAVLEELEKLNIFDCRLKRIGVHDFVEHGEASELRELYGLSTKNIIKNAIKLLKA